MGVGTQSPSLADRQAMVSELAPPENSRSPSQLGELVWEDVQGQENVLVSAGFELATLGL